MEEELMPNQKAMFERKVWEEMKKGCGALFKSGSGIIICGEKRVDGNQFLCKHCMRYFKEQKLIKERRG